MTIEDSKKPEIVFGIVSAVGTDNSKIEQIISDHLKSFDYKSNNIRVSSFFDDLSLKETFKFKINTSTSFQEIYSKMEAGNLIRRESGKNNFLAAYSIFKIFSKRDAEEGNLQGYCHIIRTLKNPEESVLLRNVYGNGYYQIGIYASDEDRLSYLQKERSITRVDAVKLIEKDSGEKDDFGQQTRETFHLSDVFIKYDPHNIDITKNQITRFIDLVFGHPHVTPTLDEQSMYMAYAFSLRSADLSRQVGAAIVSKEGDIIGLGSNDVPKFGGGPYWPPVDNSYDNRDYALGYDANELMKNRIAKQIVKKLKPNTPEDKLLEVAKDKLKDTGIFDITEFGRAVHAEMSAIMQASRVGISLKGSVLYCTTFPCHNCAKHIISTGIERVIFVEPYPKSQAENLHGDAISIEKHEPSKVNFEPYVGVSARKYIDLFSLKLSDGRVLKRKLKDSGKAEKFDRLKAEVRVPLLVTSYLDSEKMAIKAIKIGGNDDQKSSPATRKKSSKKGQRRR